MTLREYRKSRGVTQAAVARHLGISRQAYAYCEKHQESITVERVNQICRFFRCSYDDIFLPSNLS